MTRIYDVSAGDVDYLPALVTERHGKPLTDTTWQVGLGSFTTRPTSWRPADLVETVSASVVRVSMLIDNTVTPASKRYLWILPTDAPTHRAYRVTTDAIDVI